MPDAPFGVRQKASRAARRRPAHSARRRSAIPAGRIVETAVLGEPTFAESYQSLCATAGAAAPRWVAMSPERSGRHGTEDLVPDRDARATSWRWSWSRAGAHATYFYRVMPRAQYKGEPPEKLGIAAEQAVRDISEALVDCRFLREPMALPADQLRLPKYLRYRLALAVLPTLAWARAGSWPGSSTATRRAGRPRSRIWSAGTPPHATRPRSGPAARPRRRRSPRPAAATTTGAAAMDGGDGGARTTRPPRTPTPQRRRRLRPSRLDDAESKPSGTLG